MGQTFAKTERATLLAVKGVGPTVILRLEQMGIYTLKDLANRDAAEICAAASSSLGSSCWKNSPQARKAIDAAIKAAQSPQL
jgi:predicted flap endonuclease-1-like 5' DNA nuclease